MNNKILSTVIAAAMFLSMTALSGCESKATGTSSVDSSVSDTESAVLEIDSETEGDSTEASSEEENTSGEKNKDSNPDNEDTKSKSEASSNSVSSKTTSSKDAASKPDSSKSETSKTSSEGLTDDEALAIVLQNTDYTEDELQGIATNEKNGEKFHNVSFFRNGTYVFYVRDRDKKFYTYEEYNAEYAEDTSIGIDANRALAIVLQNTDYTEDELSSNTRITEDGESFYAVTFFRNGTYVFYVRVSDGKFFTYDEFNKTYYSSDAPETTGENDALRIVLDNTDYSEDELLGISEIEEDGDMFYNISFSRNGTYVFYVRQRDGRFYTYEDFNKAYNENYDGYVGHD
ncbi:MAG: hypothetical protein VZR27_09770 [Acutalibacteraceae bacterium]|nr:hypothetical protein [Acutalibacteraceae bacterium]